ncbi:MAG: hypothetical protein WBK91_09785 [Alphaproteobacteria bacterium]
MNNNLAQFIAAAGALCALNTGCAHQDNSYESLLKSVPASQQTPIYRAELPPEQAQELANQLGLTRSPEDHAPFVTIRQAPGFLDVDVRGGCDMTRLTIKASPHSGNTVILDEFLCHGPIPSKGPVANTTMVTSYPGGEWKLTQDALGSEETPPFPEARAHKQHVQGVVKTILGMAPPLR